MEMQHRTLLDEIADRRAADVRAEAGIAEEAAEEAKVVVEQHDAQFDDRIARVNEALAREAALLREGGAAIEPQVREALEGALDGDVDAAASGLASVIAEQLAHTPDDVVESVAHRVRMQLVHDEFQRDHRALLSDPVAARAVDEEFARLCPKDASGAPVALAPAQFEALLGEAAIAVGNVSRAGDTSSGESSPEGRRSAIAEIAAARGQASGER